MKSIQSSHKKLRGKNILFKKIINILKLNWVFLVFLFFAFLLTYNKLLAYLKPLRYEAVVEIAGKVSSKDSSEAKLSRLYFVHLKISTKSAFLPYEKIKISATLAIINPDLYQFASNTTKFIWFEGSQLTKAKINLENDKYTVKPNSEQDEVTRLFLDVAGKDNGRIVLLPTSHSNIYKGEAEIIYTRPGTELISLIYIGRKKEILEPIKMEIGSSIDLVNKRTNDLLFIITVLGFLLAIYTGFKIKIKKID